MVQDHTVKPGGPGNVVRSGVEEELKENLKQEKYFYTKIRSHQILTNTECVCEGKQNETDAPFSEQCSWSSRCSVVLHWYFTGTEHLSCGDTCFTLITAHIPEEKNIFCWVFFPTFCLFVSGHSSNHFIAVWLGVRVCEGGGGCIRGWGLHGPCAWESLCTTVATGQAVMAEAPSLHPFLPLLLTPQPLSMAAFVCAKYHTAD